MKSQHLTNGISLNNFAKFEMDRNADAFVYHNIFFFVSKQNFILQIVHTYFLFDFVLEKLFIVYLKNCHFGSYGSFLFVYKSCVTRFAF